MAGILSSFPGDFAVPELKLPAWTQEPGRVAIVLDGEKFVGLITRTDLINHLSLNR